MTRRIKLLSLEVRPGIGWGVWQLGVQNCTATVLAASDRKRCRDDSKVNRSSLQPSREDLRQFRVWPSGFRSSMENTSEMPTLLGYESKPTGLWKVGNHGNTAT